MTKVIEKVLGKTLQKDVDSVLGSIYRLNAINALGYLFSSRYGKKIDTGMYCDRFDEISIEQFDYYVDFRSGKTWKLTKTDKEFPVRETIQKEWRA